MTLLCLIVQDGGSAAIDALTGALRDLGVKTFVAGSYGVAKDIIAQLTFDLVFVVGTRSSPAQLMTMVRELSDLALPTLVMKATTAGDEDDFLIYEAGAVDVLPINSSVNVAALKGFRAASSPRRHGQHAEPRLSVGTLSLEPAAMVARVSGSALVLSPKQFDLLFLLASRAGKVVNRRLLERVFGYLPGESGRSLDMQILRVRKAMRAAGGSAPEISSVYGYGYCLRLPEEVQASDDRMETSEVNGALV